MRIGLDIRDGFFFYGFVVAYEVMEIMTGIGNSIDLFTHASNVQLLAQHETGSGNKVKFPVMQLKVRAAGRKKERRNEKGDVAARREIREEKKLRQKATGLMGN